MMSKRVMLGAVRGEIAKDEAI